MDPRVKPEGDDLGCGEIGGVPDQRDQPVTRTLCPSITSRPSASSLSACG
jgi:hypothetical protein